MTLIPVLAILQQKSGLKNGKNLDLYSDFDICFEKKWILVR